MRNLSKNELIDLLHAILKMKVKVANDCIDCIFNEISNALANGEEVHIAGFGNFSVSQQDERVGWDFDKSEHVAIPARKVVSFQCADNLKKILNGEPIDQK